jgi:hypothetical protein
MSLLVRTSTDAGALLVRDTDDPLALAVTESTSPLALRVRESTSPLAMRVRGLFSPTSLPGLAAWYDASDAATVLTSVGPDVPATNGQTVRRWLDKSGNNNHNEQADLALQPGLVAGSQGGLPGVRFLASTSWMQASIAGFRNFTGLTFVDICKPLAAATADAFLATFWGWGNVGTAGGGYAAETILGLASATGLLSGEKITVTARKTVTTLGQLGSSAYSRDADTAQIIAARFSSGTTLNVNGLPVALNLAINTTTSTNNTPSSFTGISDDLVQMSAIRTNGAVAAGPENVFLERLVFSRALSDDEMARLAAWAIRKWGLV